MKTAIQCGAGSLSVAIALAIGVGIARAWAIAPPPTASGAANGTLVAEGITNAALAVAPPPFSKGIFPCSSCHDGSTPVDTTPRELAYHEDIVLRHDERNRWCLDCHDAKNRDRLHLASGRPVEFSESYRLCGQCHGPTLRDWKAGEHGKRTGSWSGKKEYLLCAHCHNPHSPRIKPLKPLPAPIWPEVLR